MPLKPTFTISGYRGVWGDTLNDKIVRKYTRAFVRFLREDQKNENPVILIGRDGRESGPEIRKVIAEELDSLGVIFFDGDILPTPTVIFSVRKHGYDGGIIITASHNPIEYNGFKFVNKKALFLDESEAKKINQNCEENIQMKSIRASKKSSSSVPDFLKEHADQIVANVDVESIRAKKFKVAVDMINASACVLDPYLFEQLGVELFPLNNIPNGKFAHMPEPKTENLTDISKFVRESRADIGFAQDPDADRLVVINEKGEVGYEEHTIVLAIENVLSKNPGRTVVTQLSTSQMSTEVAEKYGSKCVLTKVGEPNVIRGIIENDAIIGGEGNGGVIYPAVNFARDSFVGIALILELLAKKNKTVSQIIETFPKYFMKKEKWPLNEDVKNICARLKAHFKEAKTIEIDGIRLDLPNNAWLHLHPSNTEPIFRLYGEAKTKDEIDALFREAEKVIFNK